MFENQIDHMVERVCRDNTNDFQTRQQAANSVISLRGHKVTRDNVKAKGRGIVGHCDSCQYRVFVPYQPKADEWGIYGQLVELNCPHAKRGGKVSHADMGPELWNMFKTHIGAPDLEAAIDKNNPEPEDE